MWSSGQFGPGYSLRPDQDSEHAGHPTVFLIVTPPPPPNTNLLSVTIHLHLLEFDTFTGISPEFGTIQYILFCLVSLTEHNCFEICPGCRVYQQLLPLYC